MCSKEHYFSSCDRFKTPQEKVDKLKDLGNCLRCGGENHFANKCKFIFYKPCSVCNGKNHFSFLCFSKSIGGSGLKSEKIKVSANCSSSTSDSCTNKIVPTFTSASDNGEIVRCLKDSGFTDCFAKKSQIDRFAWKVIEKIKVNINGVNVGRVYESELIEARFILDGSLIKIPAIAIPDIKMNLKLPSLGVVVKGFLNKNDTLADCKLKVTSDSLNTIELILGSDYSYLLPCREVLFGKSNDCSYIESAIGVMFAGELSKISRNTKFLTPKMNICNAAMGKLLLN